MRALMRSSWPVASNQPAQVTFLGILNLLELLRTYVFKFMYIAAIDSASFLTSSRKEDGRSATS